MEKGVDILAGIWYYTWAPRAATKNDFLRRPEANGKNQWENAEKRALCSTKTETLLKKVLDIQENGCYYKQADAWEMKILNAEQKIKKLLTNMKHFDII